MPKALITGGGGLLGGALLRGAPPQWELHATQRRNPAPTGVAHSVDLSERSSVEDLIARTQPSIVFHTAYSATSPERDIWLATKNVVDLARESGAALVYTSTDMVFDGEHAPYAEDAHLCPVLEYGRWKAKAEKYVRETLPQAAVVRASLLVSFSPLDPRSALVASALRGESKVTLFSDEIRSPIHVDDLAAQMWEIAKLEPSARQGIWHLAGPESMSRYTLGLLVAAHLRLHPEMLSAASQQTAAERRPRDLRLSTERADTLLGTRARPISAIATGTGWERRQ